MRRRAPVTKPDADSPASTEADADDYKPHVVKEKWGIWDVLLEIPAAKEKLPFVKALQLKKYGPYLRLFAADMYSISPALLVMWLTARAFNSIVPAASLYWSARLLDVVQEAVDRRQLNEPLLYRVALARVSCAILGKFLSFVTTQVCHKPLQLKTEKFFEQHILQAHVRLDIVTAKDPMVEQQLDRVNPLAYGAGMAWGHVTELGRLATSASQFVSQILVVLAIVRQQKHGLKFLLLSMFGPVLRWLWGRATRANFGAYCAEAFDQDYLQMMGLRTVAFSNEYRQEVVSGGLQTYLVEKHHELSMRVGDRAMTFNDAYLWRYHSPSYLGLAFGAVEEICKDAPEVLFALIAVETPAGIPLSLTWLSLLRQTVEGLISNFNSLLYVGDSLTDQFEAIRSMYRCGEIENQLADGTEPYPNAKVPSQGMGLEFKDVHFRYQKGDKWALQAVSFKLEPGELCVIVGQNGSGKSSVVKLLCRLYDADVGEILVDGHKIQSLVVEDYRKCLSVLPQDFTYLPLTIAQNIGLGDPENSEDMERIRRSAELGGALSFIEKDFPDGFNARLKPLHGAKEFACYGSDPRWQKFVKSTSDRHTAPDLSGGQWQRLALSRTFMRSADTTRLLCYDEPSAALDPIAEFDLFQRLRQLRGQKTMIFVTHRFGHLTRYADKIIYLDDSRAVEQGTHAELLAQNGGYAKLYNVQAQAFLPEEVSEAPAA